MKQNNRTVLIAVFAILLCSFSMTSCTKSEHLSQEPASIISPEFQKAIDKILIAERDSILRANGKGFSNEIDSILKAERDSIIAANGLNEFSMTLSDPPIPEPPCTMHKTASIKGTLNGITGVIEKTGNSITDFDFSITGVHGTVTQVGGITQSVHQGVITYQIVLAGTWSVSVGGTVINKTDNVLIYGNVYGCEATIGGMIITVPPM